MLEISISRFSFQGFLFKLSISRFPFPDFHCKISIARFPFQDFYFEIPISRFPFQAFHFKFSISRFPFQDFHFKIFISGFPFQNFHFFLHKSLYPGQPCPTLLRLAGGPPHKWSYGRFRGALPHAGRACGRLLPFWTPHAVRLCFSPNEEIPAYSGVGGVHMPHLRPRWG
jgi:hypothetical protein